MRNFVLVISAATVLVACGEDPHPTSPAAGARSASGQIQPTADKAPVVQAKPVDQVGFTKIVRIYSSQKNVAAGVSGAETATCPAGTTVISGSYFITGGGPFTGAPRLSYSVDDQANGWTVGFANTVDGSGPFTFVAVAYCIS